MRVGICTFSDGRERAMLATRDDCFRFQGDIAAFLKSEGHEVVEAKDLIWNWKTAKEQAGALTDASCDVVIYNFAVWAFPDFTAQAAEHTEAPILFVGCINPAYPGWVSFFASAGALEEIGRPFGRVLGSIDKPDVQAGVRRFLALHTPAKQATGDDVAQRLRGQRYGEFDGPSMGMYTGHIDQSQWMDQFGINVYHRSQLTLAWMAEKIATDRVQTGLDWLKANCKEVQFDGKQLTDGLDGTLARQVRVYLAAKDLCRDEGIDFCGLTGQVDYTEWEKGCTMDIAEALLNDTVDWEGDKKPTICATECDSNGALSMQILHELTGTPVLFADLRHYHEDLDVYDLVNSGQHAPWFAKRSSVWKENWKEIRLMPASSFYFKGGGASVQFYGAPAEKVTYARLTRKEGQYRMAMFTGSFVDFGWDKNEELGRQTDYSWPHIWAKFDCSVQSLAQNYSANHIHAVIGDYIGELIAVCNTLGIDPIVLS
ncbi:MAG TPA: fucose isomerase [Armatimonadota bacterium]|jgi:L-fucose isomerase